MKKRIFINIHYMELGGGEMRLIGILQAIDYSKYDVDLLVNSHQGELMSFIPKEVNLLPEIPEYANLENPIIQVIKRGFFKIAYARLKTKWQYHQYLKATGLKRSNEVFRLLANNLAPFLPSLEFLGTYDLAYNYMSLSQIVLQKVLAKKKIIRINTDYSIEHLNAREELKVWGAFDYVVSISPAVTESFLLNFPSLKRKIVEIDFILSPDFIRQRANQIPLVDVHREMPTEKDEIKILSVGRFCEAKNYDNVPNICRRIREMGLNIKWYIIGYGSDEMLIRRKIIEEGMEDYVIILGKKPNPYPYLLACDVYAQPSRYEGKSVTVREAQCLGKLVVVSAYPTAKSQIQSGVDGVIVPMDNEGFAEGMCDFIRNRDLREKISSYLVGNDFASKEEMDKLYKLI